MTRQVLVISITTTDSFKRFRQPFPHVAIFNAGASDSYMELDAPANVTSSLKMSVGQTIILSASEGIGEVHAIVASGSATVYALGSTEPIYQFTVSPLTVTTIKDPSGTNVPFIAVEKGVKHAAAVTAATDIFATALAPTVTPCLFRIHVAMSAAGVFSATITSGATTVTVNFNEGSNLVAEALYIFDMLVHSGDTINFRHSVNATCRTLKVQEIVVE